MKQSIWHPGTQLKAFETHVPFPIKSAKGVFIERADGRKIIDGISSWWCKSLGHGHPRLKTALWEQAEKFEHVIFANTTYDIIQELSELLTRFHKPLSKVFYAGDGSCAVEIAMKMSLHTRVNKGDLKRTKFVSLQNGYHGETIGALSVSNLGNYKTPYQSLLFECYHLEVPYVTGPTDPLWEECEDHWQSTEAFLEQIQEHVTAIVLEPLVQGAGFMRVYSQNFLKRLYEWSVSHDIHLIADEIMTGMGRTGKLFACDHAQIVPDFMCLSKGLTSGWLAFSAVLTTDHIYDQFCNQPMDKSFLHSHTYSGNALGAAVALEAVKMIIELIHTPGFHQNCQSLQKALEEIAHETGKISNIRSLGMIAAADLKEEYYTLETIRKFTHRALENGVLLRPIGNTIYWAPPLIINQEEIQLLKKSTNVSL